MLPDLARIYGLDTADDDALLDRPWWWLYSHTLALFSTPGSITGAMFHREDDTQ